MTETAGALRSVHWTVRESPIGPLLLAATEQGLANVVFRAEPPVVQAAVASLTARLGARPVHCDADGTDGTDGTDGPGPSGNGQDGGPDGGGCAPAGHLAAAVRELDAYFAGALRGFSVPLDWSLTAGFARRVLRELVAAVPYGTVVGYQVLADRVGEPGAARAVGAAMGSNPLPVVVPCHRVVESGGGIGGFGGGLEIKRALLALEGVLPAPLF